MVLADKLIELHEMANAIQKYTGISGVVYFSTLEEMTNKQSHSLGRIKLIKDDEEVSVSILKDKNDKYKTSGKNKRMIDTLIKFVEINKDLLWEYWNTPKDEADSAKTMRKFKKV